MPEGALLHVLASAALACGANLLGVAFVRSRAQWAREHALALAAFAAGVMIGAAFLHLLPEAAALVPGAFYWSIGAFLFLFIVENHLVPHRHGEADEDGHGHSHAEHHLEEPPLPLLRSRRDSPNGSLGIMVALGFALHSIFDGLAIGSGYSHDFHLGAVSTAAVLAHEIPEGMATFSVLIYARYSALRATLFGVAVALMAPLVAIASFLGMHGRVAESWLGASLALVAGSFLYIGGSDLLPEAARGRRWSHTLLVLAGASVMLLVTLVEG